MTDLKPIVPGHWATPAGLEMAKSYATTSRSDLAGSPMTDMEAASYVALTTRSGRDFESRLMVAKDRIRWLSVQLALANARHPTTTTEAAAGAMLEALNAYVSAKDDFRLFESTYPNDSTSRWDRAYDAVITAEGGLRAAITLATGEPK